jgi:hypothetical protein
MNIKDLSKEQKQYIALGLLSTAILVILMVLGIRFSMATISTAKEELDVLTDKINRANQALSRSKQTSKEYVDTIDVLKKYLANAPPERNYYSWATEVIYSKARLADLEIDSIDEISIPNQRRSGTDAAAATISFDSYSLRIMGHGGYENTKFFINLLKKDYPLVRFSGVEISSGKNPEAHDVQLFVQWPFNFGDITRNWDAIADKKLKMTASNESHEATSPAEPEAAPKPVKSVTTAVKPDAVREPHPPTTRPVRKVTPAPGLVAQQAVPKKQSMLHAAVPTAASSVAVTPKPGIQNIPGPNPVPDSVYEQEIVELSGEYETPVDAVILVDPETDTIKAAPHSYVFTRKSEKIFEERINMGSAGQDATLTSLFGGLLGEINEN